jgi:ribosome-associated toxin RatA of RatAB toxin-antitoxin module
MAHRVTKRTASGWGRAAAAALLAAFLGAAVAHARDASIEVTVKQDDGHYQVRGSFTARASVDTTWAVLTDYDGIPRFVKSVRASAVTEAADGGPRRVNQEAVQKVLLFRKTVHVALEIEEDRPLRVGFRDVLKRDFKKFEGAWTIEPRGDSVTVRYALDADPVSQPPGMIGRMVMGGSAHDQLDQVRAEILRRERSVPPNPTDGD